MKLTTLLCGSVVLLALSCGGRTLYGGGDGGPEPSSGAGGYWNAGGSTNYAGGTWSLGGSTNYAGSTRNVGGYWNAGGSTNYAGGTWGYAGSTWNVGGSTNYAGGTWSLGGSTNYAGSTWGGYLPEPIWAQPSVEPVCAGNPTPPAVAKWVDDFEGGANVFDPILVPGWAVYGDVEETITGGQGAASSTALSYWGSHDPWSTYGMQMRGYISSSPVAGKNSWGAQWQFETDQTLSSVGRPVMNMAVYTGLVVWARLAGPPGKGNMVIAFPTPETTDVVSGGDGTCGATTTSPTSPSCYAYFQAPAKVTKTCWSSIQVPFSMLKVPFGTTPPAGFNKGHVFGVEFQFSAWATAIKANWPVDVIVDDVYLYY